MQVLLNVKVDGVPVSYDRRQELLRLGNSEITPSEWRELEHRINTLITGRAGLRGKKSTGELPRVSAFIVKNLPFINKTTRGVMKKAPWYLRLFFDSVVTKEELHG